MTDSFRNDFLKGSAEFTKNTPFSIWPETNLMLDDFYKRPNVNITDNKQGLNVKNSLRHIVGSAREYQHYPYLAGPLGGLKECWDLITEPFIYMKHNRSLDYPKYLGKTIKDALVDIENNKIGRNFIKQNPKATDEDIMQYAYNQALNNYERQYAPMLILKATQNRVLNWDSFGNLYYTYEDKPQKPSVFQQKMMEDTRGIKQDRKY